MSYLQQTYASTSMPQLGATPLPGRLGILRMMAHVVQGESSPRASLQHNKVPRQTALAVRKKVREKDKGVDITRRYTFHVDILPISLSSPMSSQPIPAHHEDGIIVERENDTVPETAHLSARSTYEQSFAPELGGITRRNEERIPPRNCFPETASLKRVSLWRHFHRDW
jgi:hypothetical protein